MGYKNSLLSLTTTKPEVKAKILQQSIRGHEEYLNIRPVSCELGPKPNENFTRKIRQIGEVYYTPSYENEEMRHLKKLPNSIITE
jgi:F-box/leucine-rich repeat protein 2/20